MAMAQTLSSSVEGFLCLESSMLVLVVRIGLFFRSRIRFSLSGGFFLSFPCPSCVVVAGVLFFLPEERLQLAKFSPSRIPPEYKVSF